ncbi:MAG: cation diffusion facilitator family transporter [bacterium]
MAYGHHHHGHDHSDSSKNIGIALLLNLSFAIFELFIAYWTNSLSVLSNSLHDFGDTFSLGLSYFFDKVSQRERTSTFSYGFKRFSIIPVVVNSLILLVGSLFILYEAVTRIISPQAVKTDGMIAFALLGMVVNFIAFIRLRSGKTLNEKAASLHLLDDVLGLFAVLVGSVVMKFFDVPILDPILSLLITLFVLSKLVQNLKSANAIFLQSVPDGVDITQLEVLLKKLEHVVSVHDIHAWSLDGIHHVLTLHLVIENGLSLRDAELVKGEARKVIERLGIGHPTIEIESENEHCHLVGC